MLQLRRPAGPRRHGHTIGDHPRARRRLPDPGGLFTQRHPGLLSEVRVAGINSHVVATVGPIEFPLPVNVDDTGSYVYVGSFDSINPSIKVVDTLLDSIVQTVPLSSAPRAAHLSPATGVLYVATTGGALVRVSAAGPASAVFDETPLSSGPSDMVFSESRLMAVAAQPIPDGMVGITDFLIILANWG